MTHPVSLSDSHQGIYNAQELLPCTSSQDTISVCPYHHPRICTLSQEAFLPLKGELGESALLSRDNWNLAIVLLPPFKPYYILYIDGKYVIPPILSWQREARRRYLSDYFERIYGIDAPLEWFYAGTKVIQMCCGDRAYSKRCDTDTRVFVRKDLPVAALDHLIEGTRSFIRSLLADKLGYLPDHLPGEWADFYIPREAIRYVINPALGLSLVTVAMGDDDITFIISTGRMHTVTGKSLMLPMVGDTLVAVEGSAREALIHIQKRVIYTKTPEELYGKGPFVLWELMTHGWVPATIALNRAFTRHIITTCLARPELLLDYCNSHRQGDAVGALAFLMTGYVDVATAQEVPLARREQALQAIKGAIEHYIKEAKNAAVVREAFPPLVFMAEWIVGHEAEGCSWLPALFLFLFSLHPQGVHVEEMPSSIHSADDSPTLFYCRGYAYLLLPRRVLEGEHMTDVFPGRCYFAVRSDSSAAWSMVSEAAQQESGRPLWLSLTPPTVGYVREMHQALQQEGIRGLARLLLGEAFNDFGWFSLGPMTAKEQKKVARDFIAQLALSFKASIGLISGGDCRAIELKIIALQLLLGDTLGIQAVSMRLVALLGQVPLVEANEKGSLFALLAYLFSNIKKVEASLPDFSGLQGDLSVVDYFVEYYRACYASSSTKRFPLAHYKGLSVRHPSLFATMAPSLLVRLAGESFDEELFERLWEAIPPADATTIDWQYATPTILAQIGPRILEIDGSISQIHHLVDITAAVITGHPKESAVLAPWAVRICGLLIREGGAKSYSYAEKIYGIAADMMELSFRRSFFISLAHAFLCRIEEGEVLPLPLWMAPSIEALSQGVSLKKRSHDGAFLYILEKVCTAYRDDLLPSLWGLPKAFILLARAGHHSLVLELYKRSIVLPGFDVIKRVNITYFVVKALFQGPSISDVLLAFSLWESSRHLDTPPREYLEKMALLFLAWMNTKEAIPDDFQQSLCELCDGRSASIVLSLCDKLLGLTLPAPRVWPYLSRWLSAFIDSPYKTPPLAFSCGQQLCLAIAQGGVVGIPLEDQVEWVIRGSSILMIEEEILFAWLFAVLGESLQQEGFVTACSHKLAVIVKKIMQHERFPQVITRVNHLEVLIDIVEALFYENEGHLTESFLDILDTHPGLAEPLIGKRCSLRRAWIRVLGRGYSRKQIKGTKKQIDFFKEHPDIRPEDISEAYTNWIMNLVHAFRTAKEPEPLVVGAMSLLKICLDEGIIPDDKLPVFVNIVLNFFQQDKSSVVMTMKWSLVSDPRVRAILGESEWEEECIETLEGYACVSQDARRGVCQYLLNRAELEPSFISGHPDIYTSWIVMLASYETLTFIEFFCSMHRGETSQVDLSFAGSEGCLMLFSIFANSCYEMFCGQWSDAKIAQFRTPLIAIYRGLIGLNDLPEGSRLEEAMEPLDVLGAQMAKVSPFLNFYTEGLGEKVPDRQAVQAVLAYLTLYYMRAMTKVEEETDKVKHNMICMLTRVLAFSGQISPAIGAWMMLKLEILPRLNEGDGHGDIATLLAVFAGYARISYDHDIERSGDSRIHSHLIFQQLFSTFLAPTSPLVSSKTLEEKTKLQITTACFHELEVTLELLKRQGKRVENILELNFRNFLLLADLIKTWPFGISHLKRVWELLFSLLLSPLYLDKKRLIFVLRLFLYRIKDLKLIKEMSVSHELIAKLCDGFDEMIDRVSPGSEEKDWTVSLEAWPGLCVNMYQLHEKSLPARMVTILSYVVQEILHQGCTDGAALANLAALLAKKELFLSVLIAGGSLDDGFALMRLFYADGARPWPYRSRITAEDIISILIHLWDYALEYKNDQIEDCKRSFEGLVVTLKEFPEKIAISYIAETFKEIQKHTWARPGGAGFQWVAAMKKVYKIK